LPFRFWKEMAASESPIMQVTMPQVEIPTELCRIVVKLFDF
jgi:hypothetical protein